MDIQIQVKGVDELVRNLRDLGVNRIPNYVARALTEIANQAQDAMIAERTIESDRPWQLAHEGHQVRHQSQGGDQERSDCRGVDDRAVADRAGNEDDHHATQGVVAWQCQGYGSAGQGWQ